MSLRVVHVLLILASISLSAFFGTWCLKNYGFHSDPLMVILGYLSLSSSGGLVFYLIYFIRKTKGFGLLTLLFVLGNLIPLTGANACAVCQFGTPDSPLVMAIREGIWIILFIVAGILSSFLALFLFWAKRSRELNGK
ncbi:MAG: hypothetical protein EB078_01925 [Proteobacteria bacterium]|nr:hypothetical protein [Pseudomonadota bacterium]NDC23460.1 hypothetical protein [Pseudomonadota bacterium]NDD03639.1 hypothetical protein [Pseudomonadota bacterium]NDG26064.1 hypothetical protein [Pseudomonadota bacterium]